MKHQLFKSIFVIQFKQYDIKYIEVNWSDSTDLAMPQMFQGVTLWSIFFPDLHYIHADINAILLYLFFE